MSAMQDQSDEGWEMYQAQQDAEIEARHRATLDACSKSVLGRHVMRDLSPAARSEWETEADPEKSYEAACAEHRRLFPWCYSVDVPEPSDSRWGQDPKLVETEVDYPRIAAPDFPRGGCAA